MLSTESGNSPAFEDEPSLSSGGSLTKRGGGPLIAYFSDFHRGSPKRGGENHGEDSELKLSA